MSYDARTIDGEWFLFEDDEQVAGPFDDEAEAWAAVTIPVGVEAPDEDDCFDGSARTALVLDQDGVYPNEAPLGWCNSASIDVDRDHDQVTVSISVGDPRGAFTMQVRRTPEGKLILHVPYADEPLAHRPLKQLHPGTFEVQ